MKYPIHPAADCFPMRTDAQMAELVESIKTTGQIDTVKLLNGEVIDGRCRLAACETAGVEPRVEEIETDNPVAYAVHANLKNKAMKSKRQAAAIAADLAELPRGGNRGNQYTGGKTADSGKVNKLTLPKMTAEYAAELMGVNRSWVFEAKARKATHPEDHEAHKRGEKWKPIETEPTTKKQETEETSEVKQTSKLTWAPAAAAAYKETYKVDAMPPEYDGKAMAKKAVRDKIFAEAGLEFQANERMYHDSPRAKALAEAINRLYIAQDPEKVKKANAAALGAVRPSLTKADHKELDKAIAYAQQQMEVSFNAHKAEWDKKMAEKWEQVTALGVAAEEEKNKQAAIRKGMQAVMPAQEFKNVLRKIHSDRFPEEYRPVLDEAAMILKKYIEPALNVEPKPKKPVYSPGYKH